MEIFVSLTLDGMEEAAPKAVDTIFKGIQDEGHSPHSMLRLTDDERRSLGLVTDDQRHTLDLAGLRKCMDYATERIIYRSSGLVCVVTGDRIGPGALVEVGIAKGARIPTIAVQKEGASTYLEAICDSAVTYRTEEELLKKIRREIRALPNTSNK